MCRAGQLEECRSYVGRVSRGRCRCTAWRVRRGNILPASLIIKLREGHSDEGDIDEHAQRELIGVEDTE